MAVPPLKYVGRLDIAVQKSFMRRRRQRIDHRQTDAGDARGRQLAQGAQLGLQAHLADILHDDERELLEHVDVEHAHDVRVIQAYQQLRLGEEALHAVRIAVLVDPIEALDRDRDLQHLVKGAEDRGGGPFAELLLQGQGPLELNTRWQPVIGAQRYRLELLRSDGDSPPVVIMTSEVAVPRHSRELRGIEVGSYLLRVSAIDDLGAIGVPSVPRRLFIAQVPNLEADGVVRLEAGGLPQLKAPPGQLATVLIDGAAPPAAGVAPGTHRLRVVVGGLSAEAPLVVTWDEGESEAYDCNWQGRASRQFSVCALLDETPRCFAGADLGPTEYVSDSFLPTVQESLGNCDDADYAEPIQPDPSEFRPRYDVQVTAQELVATRAEDGAMLCLPLRETLSPLRPSAAAR